MQGNTAEVIVVGFTRHPAAAVLARRLQSFGFNVIEAESPDELPSLLKGRRRAAIAVYSPRRTNDAHRVMETLAEAQRDAPVVVLVDETDFGEYYSLMNQGAKEYFGISERPEVILRGLAWAARSLGD
jgi:DNA-binding NtrC family response regulator